MAKSKRTTRHAKMVAASSKGSPRKKVGWAGYNPNRGFGNTSLPLNYDPNRTPYQPM